MSTERLEKNTKAVSILATIKKVFILTFALTTAAALSIVAYNIYRQISFVEINGEAYSCGIEEINLSGKDISEDITPLYKLTRLKRADLTNCSISVGQYEKLKQKLPDCDIFWSVAMGDNRYPSNADTLVLNDSIAPSELKKLEYFTGLQTLDARSYPLCDELYEIAFAGGETPYKCLFETTLCGKELTSDTQKLDISELAVSDVSDFYQKLRFFPNLEEVFLGSCKVPDEELDKLNTSLPDTNIVWIVKFGIWKARTDIKVFSTFVGQTQPRTFNEKQLYSLLHYCKQLVALDLGHNNIKSMKEFTELKNLEILVLACTPISDLSGIEQLQKLEYIELFTCEELDDLSPLGELPNLQELELQNSKEVSNLAALKKCKKLKMLFISNVRDKECSAEEMMEALPDCQISTKGNTPAASGWRATDKNQQIKIAFANWQKIVTYNHWDDVTYSGKLANQPKYQPTV